MLLNMGPSGFRRNIVELLKTIASSGETQECAKLIPGGDVSGELIREWFDDLYLLDEKRDSVISPEVITRYKSQFNSEELDAMKRFHDFFSEHVDFLGKHYSAHTLLLDPVWKDITDQAATALWSFENAGDNEGGA